jgi:hypothetical protein
MNSCKSSFCCSQKVLSVCASNACLVVSCVLGVMHLEVHLIGGIFFGLVENQNLVNVTLFVN